MVSWSLWRPLDASAAAVRTRVTAAGGARTALKRCRDYYQVTTSQQGKKGANTEPAFPDWRKRKSWKTRKTPCKNPFFPDWREGQSWVVEYVERPHYMDPKSRSTSTTQNTIMEYRVEEDGEVDGHATYTIGLYLHGLNDWPVHIGIRKDTGVLVQIDRHDSKDSKGYMAPCNCSEDEVFAYMQVTRLTYRSIEDFGDFCNVTHESLSKSEIARRRERIQRRHKAFLSEDGIVGVVPRRCEVPPCPAHCLQEIRFHKHKKEMTVRLIAENHASQVESGIKGGMNFHRAEVEARQALVVLSKKGRGQRRVHHGRAALPLTHTPWQPALGTSTTR